MYVANAYSMCVIVAMGQRKFRLHQKKRFSRLPKSSLMVSFPRPRSNWELLSRNVKEAQLGSWSYVSTTDNDRIAVSKFNSFTPPVALMTITILSSTIWTLHIGHKCLPRIAALPATICSVTDLSTVITAIDKLNLCTGIKDKKFAPLIQLHKGEFHNPHGKCS